MIKMNRETLSRSLSLQRIGSLSVLVVGSIWTSLFHSHELEILKSSPKLPSLLPGLLFPYLSITSSSPSSNVILSHHFHSHLLEHTWATKTTYISFPQHQALPHQSRRHTMFIPNPRTRLFSNHSVGRINKALDSPVLLTCFPSLSSCGRSDKISLKVPCLLPLMIESPMIAVYIVTWIKNNLSRLLWNKIFPWN